MYQKEYEKVLEQLKTVPEYMDDCSNRQRCIQNIQQYNRSNAWNCIQEMIHKYASEIKIFGAFVDGVSLIHNVDINCCSDQYLKDQLQYIATHIPIYVLIRKGEHELARKLGEWWQARFNGQK